MSKTGHDLKIACGVYIVLKIEYLSLNIIWDLEFMIWNLFC